MQEPSLLLCGFLFLLGLVAGTIDSIAGGGGLLSIPGLMAAGLDPLSAFATGKLQGIFGSLSATLHFRRKDKIRLRQHLWPAVTIFIAAIFGAASLSSIDPSILRIVTPILLIGIAIWTIFSPQLGHVPRKARCSFLVGSLTFLPVIGFYNGFFGPGTGTFYAMGLVAFLGLTLHDATIHSKFYNMMSNLGALLFFMFGGHIAWLYALPMIMGTTLGGAIGARLVLKHGTKLIKPLLVTMSLAMSLKLLWQQNIIQKMWPFS